MPTNVLTTDSTNADSSDVVVAANEELTVCIKDAAGPGVDTDAKVDVLLKDDGGLYFRVDQLGRNRMALIVGAGTWRFTRVSGTCGVFSG